MIDAHAEDYSEPFGDHIDHYGLCYFCHLLLHCRHVWPAAFQYHADRLNESLWLARPLATRSFPTLRRIAIKLNRGDLTVSYIDGDVPERGGNLLLLMGTGALVRAPAVGWRNVV